MSKYDRLKKDAEDALNAQAMIVFEPSRLLDLLNERNRLYAALRSVCIRQTSGSLMDAAEALKLAEEEQ